LLTDAKRKSHVSMEDSAIAMVEEVEQPVQSRQQASEGHHHG
jgi:putative NADH-flavin reductase